MLLNALKTGSEHWFFEDVHNQLLLFLITKYIIKAKSYYSLVKHTNSQNNEEILSETVMLSVFMISKIYLN